MARERARLSLETAARRARVSCRYLAQVERRGTDSHALASRLAALYRCPLEVFLHDFSQGVGTRRTSPNPVAAGRHNNAFLSKITLTKKAVDQGATQVAPSNLLSGRFLTDRHDETARSAG